MKVALFLVLCYRRSGNRTFSTLQYHKSLYVKAYSHLFETVCVMNTSDLYYGGAQFESCCCFF